jgi:hypothetical protein
VKITVVYEDQLAAGATPKEFGVHKLVVAAVADVLGLRYFEVDRRIEPIPKKGSSNVIIALRDDGLNNLPALLVLLDADKIRSEGLLKLSANSSMDEVLDRLAEVTVTQRSAFILLDRNVESILQAAADCEATIDGNALQRALNKKLNERDRILNKVAFAARAVRDCIFGKVPSLEVLRHRIVEMLHKQ